MAELTPLTPLMRQYEALKAAHPGALLLFRVGDFYELFGEDAVAAAPILDIVLTTRDKQKDGAVPLCGVPHHAVSGYIAKLLAAGKTVALAEQMEEPRPGILVRRDIVRILTPGTVLDDDLLPGRDHAFLAAVVADGDDAALARVDISTGECLVTSARGADAPALVAEDLARAAPREVLVGPGWSAERTPGPVYQACPPDAFEPEAAARALREQFPDDEPWRNLTPIERRAAGALIRYVRHTLRGRTPALTAPVRYAVEEFVGLDAAARRTLEITQGADGGLRGSLLWAMDESLTPMGGRLLRERLLRPLRSRLAIEGRQADIAALLADPVTRAAVREGLRAIQDVERAIARVAMAACAPRDLALLARSLEASAGLAKTLAGASEPCLAEWARGWEAFGDLVDLLTRALITPPPPTAREGGVIRDGYHADLDDLRAVRRDGAGWIAKLEARERARTGIDSLKIRHNQVFGYYLEVTKANAARVPPDYHRKQTLVNAERYVTPELADLEATVLGAEEKIRALEAGLFEDLRRAVAADAVRIQAHARRLAALDVAAGLAEAASRHRWIQPRIVDEPVLRLVGGRHPVVERLLPAQRFVPNDTDLDANERRLLLLTGPNMAGKSTYMRQVALIALMAQMGAYVPAEEATIGLVDRIFTRVGAHDDIAGGRSTFMVEMSETAAILARATPRSLILLDEIGRGTSTFDGLSIAWAVAEDAHNRIGARTLFATHYHELTELANTLPGLKNYKAAVREWNDEIVFLRTIVEGGADRSYGIQVARLAGLPESVIRRAREILADLERRDAQHAAVVSALAETQPDLFTPPAHPVLEELARLDLLTLTPLDAMNILDRLQKQARERSPKGD